MQGEHGPRPGSHRLSPCYLVAEEKRRGTDVRQHFGREKCVVLSDSK